MANRGNGTPAGMERGAIIGHPYVIVDVETTGQSARYGRIIEIAIIRVEKGRIVGKFESLVNPERYISPMIEGLTGISNDDVAGAPTFSAIARKIHRLVDGAVFVAHNARFDYSFLTNEFRALGLSFSARCLCTVKLSRKLFPEHRHHDLSSLIERHALACESRHRAMGDAQAVYEFLRLVELQGDPERVRAAIGQVLKSGALPAQLERQSLDDLPESPGVYLLFGKEGELLYVGKSVNVRERVRSHFSGDQSSAKEMEMCRQVYRVESRPTAGELGALLLESKLIKELRPLYNRMARRRRNLVVARRAVAKGGYLTVSLEEIEYIDPGGAESIMAVFKHVKQANEYLIGIARSHRLCQKLLGLEQGKSYCFGYQLKHCDGACAGEEPPESYNLRFEDAFARRRVRSWPYEGGVVIEEKEPRTGQGEVFMIDNWCLVSSFRYSDFGVHPLFPGSHRFDYDSYKILSRYLLVGGKKNVRQLRREEFDGLLARVGEPG